MQADALLREIAARHGAARPARYWLDCLGSAALGWAAFAALCTTDSPWLRAGAGLVAVLALYRALLFNHELSHPGGQNLPGFLWAWNLLVGLPLLLPSCVIVGVHAHHHRPDTYGTAGDPEYLPFARSRPAIAGLLAVALLTPVLMALRFLVLSPVLWLLPPLRRLADERLTSLAMNSAFRRRPSPTERRLTRLSEVALVLGACGLGLLLARGLLPWRALPAWLAVSVAISELNALRALAAHRYASAGAPLDREGQTLDSVDSPGGWWSELWAPVGHRYHALHHHLPGLPYHQLGAVHRELLAALPADDPYRRAVSPGLGPTLRALWAGLAVRPGSARGPGA